MFDLKTEYLFDVHFTAASFAEWMIVGDGGWGTRIIIPATAGIIEGPKIRGRVIDFGADWLVIRHDNVCVADVRLVLETDDGALIHMYYDGIFDLKEEQIIQLLSGKYLQFKAPVHTTPRFETGHKDYLWLNKIKGAAIGEVNTFVDPTEVNYSVYALR